MPGEWHPGKAVPAGNPCWVVCPEFGRFDANGQRQLDAERVDNGMFLFFGDVCVEQAQMRRVGPRLQLPWRPGCLVERGELWGRLRVQVQRAEVGLLVLDGGESDLERARARGHRGERLDRGLLAGVEQASHRDMGFESRRIVLGGESVDGGGEAVT